MRSRLNTKGLFEGFSKNFNHTKFGNSNWLTIGKIPLNGSPERLVRALQACEHATLRICRSTFTQNVTFKTDVFRVFAKQEASHLIFSIPLRKMFHDYFSSAICSETAVIDARSNMNIHGKFIYVERRLNVRSTSSLVRVSIRPINRFSRNLVRPVKESVYMKYYSLTATRKRNSSQLLS